MASCTDNGSRSMCTHSAHLPFSLYQKLIKLLAPTLTPNYFDTSDSPHVDNEKHNF